MAQRSASRLLDLDLVDIPDKHDEEMGRCYDEFLASTGAMSTHELHAYVHNTSAARATMLALLYSVLIDRAKAESHFELLRVSNRDNYATIMRQLDHLIEFAYFPRLKNDVRRQLLWMVDKLTAANVAGVETLHFQLLRQLRGGDVSPSTTTLCRQLVELCETHRLWVEGRPKALHSYVYSFLRIISDHKSPTLKELQQAEIDLTIRLLRHNWIACCSMGRDLVRALQDVSRIPEFGQLWVDILGRPQTLHKNFEGVLSILHVQTPPELLRTRLTPQMEISLRWIFDKLTAANYQRNLDWFVKRWLSTSLSENFYADVVRYIVAGWYPSNELLQSDKVPRYVVIGTLFTYIKSHVAAANVKLSLFLDWMFFAPDANIMLIEPAMLLMERSIKYHPYITCMLLEYLRFAIDEYHPPLSDYMMKCVGVGMKDLLRKGVIKRLTTLYNFPTMDDTTKRYMMDMFAGSLDFTGGARQPTPTPQRTDNVTPNMSSDENAMPKSDSVSTPKYINRASTPAASEGEEHDLDEYLYGTDNTTAEYRSARGTSVEDEVMTDATGVAGDIDSPQVESSHETAGTPGMQTPDPSRKSDDMDTGSTHDFSTDKLSNSEESSASEDESSQIQHQQSFWMFADLLTRFQDASKTIKTARANDDVDEMQAHSYICKKNLREVLNIYLKMEIPAKNLVPSLAKHIRESSCSSHANDDSTTADGRIILDQDAAIQAEAMDSIDLLFITIWHLRDSESQKKKMIDFISCVMHLSKKGGKHLIGMRWWSFFARKLQDDQPMASPLYPDWCASVCDMYKSIVLLSRESLSTDDDSATTEEFYYSQYLVEDLKLLQDYDIVAIQHIAPMMFKYSPDVCIGNKDIIQLLVSSLLPDKIPVVATQMSCGYLQIFGDENLGSVIVESLSWETFEQIVFWRLLQAEAGGSLERIETLMEAISNENLFELTDIHELLTALPVTIVSVPPATSILRQLVSMLPEVDSLSATLVSSIVEVLNRWRRAYPDDLQICLMESLDELISAIQAEPSEEITKVGEHFVSIFVNWWKLQSSSDDGFWSKSFMSKLITLGGLAQYEIPVEWNDMVKKSKKRQAVTVFSDSD